MTYRVYYNREIDWPQCWSVDEGDQSSEINVVGVDFGHCRAVTVVMSAEQRAQADPKRFPAAWVQVEGKLSIYRGRAQFDPV